MEHCILGKILPHNGRTTSKSQSADFDSLAGTDVLYDLFPL